jgi:citrate lyase subunit beta/citryl-CoA lyase
VTPDLALVRSVLFAPAGEERKLRNALASAADAVVADLEDATAPDEKAAARETVEAVLSSVPPGGPLRALRVNAPGTEWFADDLALTERLALDVLVLPKATPDTVGALGAEGLPVLAIVETAVGVRLAYETAALPRVVALALGSHDLAAELLTEPRPDGAELLYARSKLVTDSAAAGIRPPFDVVFLDFRDAAGLEAQAALARSLGFRGKLCIHPDQIEPIRRVFAPTDAELDWARRVLEAHEAGLREGRGAVALDGRMIDAPVVSRAQRLLDEAVRRVGTT